MAFQAGKAGYVNVDTAAGTAKDLSAYCTNVEGFPGSVAALDTTTYGKNSKTVIPGLRDCTVTMTFLWDPTATSGPDAVLSGRITTPAVQTIVHGPMGNTTGNISYTAEALLTDWKVGTPAGGLVTGTATFQCSGDVAVSVF